MQQQQSSSRWARLCTEVGHYDPLMAGSIDGTDKTPHDRGIIRAIEAKYKPNKCIKGRPEATIFVARLNHATTKDTLHEFYSKYGKIENCCIVRDVVTCRSKGYAFIEFKHRSDAEDAQDAVSKIRIVTCTIDCKSLEIKTFVASNKMYIDNSQIFVDMECERILPGWKPRRLGGGLGGKKESGQLRFGGKDRPFRKPIILGKNSLQRGRQNETFQRDEGFYRGREHFRYDRDKQHNYNRRHRSRSRSR